MLNVILYSSRELPFSSYQKSKETKEESLVIVANPEKSDLAREELIKLGLADLIQTTTISKFTQDFLKAAELDIVLSKKADIVKGLCFGWMKGHGEKDFNRFLTAYNIFSELRGFSTDLGLLDEVLDFFDQDLAKGVRDLWRLYDLWGTFLDEHQAYQLMSKFASEEQLEKIQKILPPKLIFWGFDHLSGTQIDLLKNLALYFEVDVLYSKELYRVKKSTDWISWLAHDLEVVSDDKALPAISVYTYPRLRLSEIDYDLNLHSLVFATSKLKPELLLQMPSATQHFNYSINPFDHFINQLRDELLNKEGEHVDEILVFLRTYEQELKKQKNFKEIKVIELYKDFFSTILWPSFHSKRLSIFLVELAHYVVGLKKPRVSLLPLKKDLSTLRILDASDYLEVRNEHMIMLALAEHSSLRSAPALMSKEAEEKLMILGPLYNKSQFYQSFKMKLQKDLAQGQVTLLLEDGVLEKEAAWEEILSDFPEVSKLKLEKKPSTLDTLIFNSNFHRSDSEKKEVLPLSYSAFQAYYECPRKFALQYLEKRAPMAELDHALGSSQLGELEHAIIEAYFKGVAKEAMNTAFVSEKHESLVRKMMADFLLNKNISLNSEDYDQAFYEILSLSESGILFLLELMKSKNFKHIVFEKDFKSAKLRGRIDALIHFSWGDLIVDFKRSGGSIPNLGQLSRHEKVQMPVYLSHAKTEAKGFAYINLSDMSESIFMLEGEALDDLKSLALDMKLRDFSLHPWLETYQVLEDKILAEYESELHFNPKPRSPDVCTYCLLNNVCTRSYV
jgi:hypothetical protein